MIDDFWKWALVAAAIMLVLFGVWPYYDVWASGLAGQAALNKATYDRQVAVVEAEAKNASAAYEASAEVTRAYGVAQANVIIGESLKKNEDYLRYLWVNNIDNTQNQIIYIPTEANLPILEASRETKGGASSG